MYKKILVPIDGSELSKKAVIEAVKFASEIGASIIFCNIVHSSPSFYSGIGSIFSAESIDLYKNYINSVSKNILDKACVIANEKNVENEPLSIEGEEVYKSIIEAVADKNCDLIFMASHGYSAAESIFLGGQTSKILTYSSVPVLIFK